MKKLDYLKYAISKLCPYEVNWMLMAFAVTRPVEIKLIYSGMLKVEPWGLSFLNESGEFERIDDSVPNVPLFRFKDKITIDNTWLPNVQGNIETTIGNLIYNCIAIVYGFGSKFPYVTGRVKLGNIETEIASKLRDTPKSEGERSNLYYYVDEYLRFVEGTKHVEQFSQLCAVAATRKTITAPTGIKEFKAKLLEKYKGKLTDPVEMAKFKKELSAFDEEYLKGDPANETLVADKLKNNSRMRMYLSIASDQGFSENIAVTPIPNSLEEGWPTDPEQYASMMNGLRKGSFDRGSETIKGGVSAKVLLRAANNFVIKDKDCGSTLGVSRKYTKENLNTLIGKYIISAGKIILVENQQQALNYLDKQLTLRSPAFCREPGESICKVCAGKNLSQYPTGVTIPLTEISGMLLAASMKGMHLSELKLGKIDLKTICT